MLASGAHVKIGDKEFRVAFQEEGAYQYSQNPTGEQVQFWLFDDWSGGEGNEAHDPLDEIVYHQGLVNPRIPGILTTPPTRVVTSSGALTPAPNTALHAIAGGRLWLFAEAVSGGATSYYYSDDLDSGVLAEEATSAWNAAVDNITAVTSDGTNIYVCGMDTAFDYEIRMFPGNTTDIDSNDTTVRAYANSNTGRVVGMAVMGGYLYTWNGKVLNEINLDGFTETAIKTLGNTLSGLTYGTDFWAGIVNGDTSVYFFHATEGKTTVLEKTLAGEVGEIWTLPNGFTGKSLVYQSGALVVIGEYLGDAAAFGMSVISRQPIFLGYVRLGTTLNTQISGAGFGTEIIFAEKSTASPGANLFIYDIAQDAFSELDVITLASGEIHSIGTFEKKRFALVEDGSALRIYTWTTDDNPSTSVDGRMETGAWDMDLPEDEKQLDGFHVLSNANSTRTVDIYYQDNEDGVWTSAGTATTGFHNYIAVSNASSTVKFRTLRFRVDPKVGAEVYSVSCRYRVNSYEETWELLLDLSDEEVDQTRGRRRRSHQDKGWQLRDYIRDIADNKAVVTFLDGAKYPQGEGDDPDKYSTHTVVVDIPSDQLVRPGEGTMSVRLRSVTPN
jgi:hypothetical protein